SGFLQIPPRDGHPCLWLTVPTAKPVADFHRLVIAHAGRTTTERPVRYRSVSNGSLCNLHLRLARHLRHDELNLGSFAGCGADGQRSADPPRPLLHREQADAAALPAEREADPAVADEHFDVI